MADYSLTGVSLSVVRIKNGNQYYPILCLTKDFEATLNVNDKIIITNDDVDAIIGTSTGLVCMCNTGTWRPPYFSDGESRTWEYSGYYMHSNIHYGTYDQQWCTLQLSPTESSSSDGFLISGDVAIDTAKPIGYSPIFIIKNAHTDSYICFSANTVAFFSFVFDKNPGIPMMANPPVLIDNTGATIRKMPGIETHDNYFTVLFEGNLDLEGEDSYEIPGESQPAGGDGTFDFESTDIPFSPLPNIGAYDTGFISLYKPSATQLKNLASYMWSGAFDIENFRKLVADPMSAILGLSIIPCTATAPGTTSAELKVGNISTGISMPRCTEQYYELNCGKINISPKWGAYLDFSPYSKLTLYLPYIGYVPLSPDDCMNGSVEIRYKVDILSGSCVVEVRCVSNRGKDAHVLYTFNGNCSCACPVTNGQYTNGAVGILHAASAITQSIGSGNILGGIEEAANTALSMVKPDITRSGEFGGSAGLLGNQYPYLILTIPRMCTPENQSKYIGYPSFITKTIGSLTGYNEMSVTHLEGMSATEEECNEIINLLESGVII